MFSLRLKLILVYYLDKFKASDVYIFIDKPPLNSMFSEDTYLLEGDNH